MVESQIVEGFVMRRWKDGVEVASVKFKVWLYQMVTQVLRPSLNSGGNNLAFRVPMHSLKAPTGEFREEFLKLVDKEVPHWCVASSPAGLALCRRVVLLAAEGCLPDGHPQLRWSAAGGDAFPADAEVPEGCVARSPDRAYWIALGDRAVARLLEAMGPDMDADGAADAALKALG